MKGQGNETRPPGACQEPGAREANPGRQMSPAVRSAGAGGPVCATKTRERAGELVVDLMQGF